MASRKKKKGNVIHGWPDKIIPLKKRCDDQRILANAQSWHDFLATSKTVKSPKGPVVTLALKRLPPQFPTFSSVDTTSANVNTTRDTNVDAIAETSVDLHLSSPKSEPSIEIPMEITITPTQTSESPNSAGTQPDFSSEEMNSSAQTISSTPKIFTPLCDIISEDNTLPALTVQDCSDSEDDEEKQTQLYIIDESPVEFPILETSSSIEPHQPHEDSNEEVTPNVIFMHETATWNTDGPAITFFMTIVAEKPTEPQVDITLPQIPEQPVLDTDSASNVTLCLPTPDPAFLLRCQESAFSQNTLQNSLPQNNPPQNNPPQETRLKNTPSLSPSPTLTEDVVLHLPQVTIRGSKSSGSKMARELSRLQWTMVNDQAKSRQTPKCPICKGCSSSHPKSVKTPHHHSYSTRSRVQLILS